MDSAPGTEISVHIELSEHKLLALQKHRASENLEFPEHGATGRENSGHIHLSEHTSASEIQTFRNIVHREQRYRST